MKARSAGAAGRRAFFIEADGASGMQTKRAWRKQAEGEELHHLAATVTTSMLNAIEELATRERISRSYAAGKLVELGVQVERQRKKAK
jgi:hypothetical protein